MTVTGQKVLHILLVDDDPLVVKVYAECMRFEGWTVAIARDGWEAGQETRRTKFDMILLDIRMPYQDGWGVLRDIRQGGPNINTPVYILTGISENGTLKDSLRRGADGVFQKSEVRPDELVVRIGEILSSTEPSEEEPAPPPPQAAFEMSAPAGAGSSNTSARAGQEFVVYVNPFLGDGSVLSETLNLPQPFTCPICQGQVCLKLRFDEEGTGLAGGFRCSRCEMVV